MAGDTEDVVVRISGDATPLNKALTETEAKLQTLGSSLKTKSGVNEAFTEATTSLQKLGQAVEQTKGITDAQVGSVESLSRQYVTLAQGVGATIPPTEKLDGSTKGVVASMRGLHSALEEAGGGLGKFVAGAVAVGEAFAFGWREGEHLRKTLNELSDGGFDKLVQKLPQFQIAMALLAPSEESAADKAELLTNQLNILKHNGIDPTGLSAEEVAAKVDALGKAKQKLGTEINALLAEFDKEESKLHDVSAALVATIKDQERSGTVTDQLREQFKEWIKAALDGYDKRHEKADEALLAEAKDYGVLSSAQEKQADAAKKAQEEEIKRRQEIHDSVVGEQKDREAITAAVVEYAQQVAKSGSATQEQSDQIKKDIQAELDEYAKLGIDAPADLVAVGKAWGVVASDAEKSSKRTTAAIQAVADAAAGLIKTLSKGTGGDSNKDKQDLADLVAARAKLASQPTFTVDDLNKLAEMDQQISDLSGKINDFGNQFKGANDAAIVSTKDLNSALNQLLDSVAPKLADLTQGQRDLLRDALNRAQQLGSEGTASVDSIANAFKDVTNALDDAGIDTTKLKTALADAKGQAVDFNAVFDDADKKGGRAKLVGDVAQLQKDMKGTKTATDDASESMDKLKIKIRDAASFAKDLRSQLAGTSGSQAGGS